MLKTTRIVNNTMKNTEKNIIHDLYNILNKRNDQSSELLDILDVLLQVYKELDKIKNSEALINRLTQYIRITASSGRINFSSSEEKLVIKLSIIGQKAGLNGVYMADFSDKTQFYKFGEEVPFHK